MIPIKTKCVQPVGVFQTSWELYLGFALDLL